MSHPRPSIFRDALQVSPELIARMSDADLNKLMLQLLRAQSYRCGSPANEIRVNAEGRAKDDGCDGWSAKPERADDWLGSADTCWQFKARAAGEPSRLAGEVVKQIPRETLVGGGRFVLIASGSASGKRGEDDRRDALRREAEADNIPTSGIDVVGSERLALWCNQHPAVAACWAGRPDGLWTLADWASSEEHQFPWRASEPVVAEIGLRRVELDPNAGSVFHLHIHGPPGVGKTRFALELCRGAEWCGAVIYVRDASDLRLPELLDSAVRDLGVQLVVVADEVQFGQLRTLRDSVGRGEGRVRLITVGLSRSPDPNRIPALEVKPLSSKLMSQVIKGWHPSMPLECVDYIARFADGYVRLACMTARAVLSRQAMSIGSLLGRDEIRMFLDGMLGADDRRALYVVAVLSCVGWSGEREAEGQIVANHLGLDWNDVRYEVEACHRRYGIAPQGGRYRYISPAPLGIRLAVEAWTIYPGLLRTLPDALRSDEARDAYYERLEAMASTSKTQEFARKTLPSFSRLEDFVDAQAVRRWSALSAADPAGAAGGILRVLLGATVEQRMGIEERARREAVRTLVRLGWGTSSFRDAVKALALLAEAENETFADNASEEFVAKFRVVLGGTAVPYCDRLNVLNDILAMGRPSLMRLVVRALAQVGSRCSWRRVSGPPSDEVPEREWRPTDDRERLACVEHAMRILAGIADSGDPELREDLVMTATELARFLRSSPVREHVVRFYGSVRRAYPDAREELRRSIWELLCNEKRIWRQLDEGALSEIESLHSQFEDRSLGARLRQYVGQPSWASDERADLASLARELVADRDVLSTHWPWLTSGEAVDGWRLGEALAVEDAKGDLDSVLSRLDCRGRDLRVLCGYVAARRERRGVEWFEAWLDAEVNRTPPDLQVLFEVSWRLGATARTAVWVTRAIREYDVDVRLVGQLGLGRWGEDLPVETLAEVLDAMIGHGHHETAVAILEYRMKKDASELDKWEKQALALVTSRELIRSSQMSSYYWKEIADQLVTRYAREIASAIFRAQVNGGDRASGTWFLEHSQAVDVLYQCVRADAQGVWEELRPYLAVPAEANMFSIGFPDGVVDLLPANEVGRWIAEDPRDRAALVAKLVSMDFASDQTLAARLLGDFGHDGEVAEAFFSAYLSGSCTGQASAHWRSRARALEGVATKTRLHKLKGWAEKRARKLEKMAEEEEKWEKEEDLRRR